MGTGYENLLALGAIDQIAALAGFYDPLDAATEAEIADIPSIGTSMAWPSKEVLLSQAPDLVVSESLEGFAFDTANGYASVEEIEESGGQVFIMSMCSGPEAEKKSFGRRYSDLEALGKVLGRSAEATALISDLQAQEQQVKDAVADTERVKVAFFNGGTGPLNVLSGGIWSAQIDAANGENVLPAVFQMSLEEFAATSPDVILVGTFPGPDLRRSSGVPEEDLPGSTCRQERSHR